MDLFGHNGKGFFCPYDGEKLTESRWEWCGSYLLTCSNSHVWEVTQRNWMDELSYRPITMVRCGCGQVSPRMLMTTDSGKTDGKKICPACHEKIKQAWRPDLKRSHARLVITPIRRGDKVIFPYEEEVRIQPYPNPYGCGGCWGSGTMETEEEVEKRVKNFTAGIAEYPFTDSWYGQWKKLGVKFEVIRKPEMTAAEHINERERDYVEEHPEEADKPEHTQMRLIA